jgi:hypothetical protein
LQCEVAHRCARASGALQQAGVGGVVRASLLCRWKAMYTFRKKSFMKAQ